MKYQTIKGANKRPALCKSSWLQFISLAGLAKYRLDYRASIEHSCSAGELAYKVAVLPFFFVKIFILLTTGLRNSAVPQWCQAILIAEYRDAPPYSDLLTEERLAYIVKAQYFVS